MRNFYKWTVILDTEEHKKAVEADIKDRCLDGFSYYDGIKGHDVYSSDGTFVSINPANWGFGAKGRALQVTLVARSDETTLRRLTDTLGPHCEKDVLRDGIPVRNFL